MDPEYAYAAGPSTSQAQAPPASPLRDSRGPNLHASSPARSPMWSPKSRVTYSDRFIPSRAPTARLDFSILDREMATSEVSKQATEREDLNPGYNLLLRSELLGATFPGPISPDKVQQLEQLRAPASPGKSLFRFKTGDVHSPHGGPSAQSPFVVSPVGDDTAAGSPFASPRRAQRRIARAPFKVLDAPSLADDFYLNLVDWSSQNVLAVGLGTCVYLWSASSSTVTKLCDLAPADSVCSVEWSCRGTYLSVGTNSGKVQIWDVAKLKLLRTMDGHRARVGTQAWGSHVLCSGSRDRHILQRDIRCPEHFTAKLVGHRSEVCGLKWSPDDRQLASGGNDNQLYIWSLASSSPQIKFSDHTAAVKRPCNAASLTHTRAGQRRRHRGPLHPLLEHLQRHRHQLHRHRQPGVQHQLEQERERDRVHPRLQPEPGHHLEVPQHGQAGHTHRPHAACAVPGGVTRRPDHRDGRRRRDAALLVRVPVRQVHRTRHVRGLHEPDHHPVMLWSGDVAVWRSGQWRGIRRQATGSGGGGRSGAGVFGPTRPAQRLGGWARAARDVRGWWMLRAGEEEEGRCVGSGGGQAPESVC